MPPRAGRAGRDRAGRQAGRALVVRARRRAPPPHRRADGPRRNARPVRDRAARAAVGRGDAAGAVLRRAGQALRHRGRPHRDDDDRRSRRRDRRAARAAVARRARRAARAPPRRDRAADPGRICGEDRRRARVQARTGGARRSRCRCAARRSTRSTCSRDDGEPSTLDLHVSSGTYVRSIADGARRPLPHAAAHGGRPVRGRGGRRRSGCCRSPRRSRGSRPRRVARVRPVRTARAARARGRSRREGRHAPGELERRPRAVAIGTFDGVHLGPPRGRPRGDRGRARCRRSSRSTRIRARCSATRSALLATLERRLELLAELGVEETLVVEFTPELAALEPEEFASAYLARDRRRRSSSPAKVPLRPRRAAAISALLERARARERESRRSSQGVSSTRIRQLVAAGDVRGAARAARPAGRGRGNGRLGRGARRHARLPDREPPHRARRCSSRRFGIYAGAGARPRAAVSIGVNPHYGGAERKIEVFLLDFEGDLYGERLVVELWQRLRDEAAFESGGGARRADRARRRGDARRDPPGAHRN